MKIENYNNTKNVLMNLSNLMRKEDWDSIAIIEESGEFTKAIDESVSIISNVTTLITDLQQEIDSYNKDASKDFTKISAILNAYYKILAKI